MSNTQGRTRTRGGSPPPEAPPARSGGTPSFAQRGAAGASRSREVRQEQTEERQKRREVGYVRRLRLEQGKSADVIVLDAHFADVWFFNEHTIPGPGMDFTKAEEVICMKDHDSCPICELAESGGRNSRFRRSSYMMFLTVLNLTGYWSKKHNKQVAPVKELLAVKGAQHDEFISILEAAERIHGTIRGLEMTLKRGTGETAPNTGVPTIGNDGQMFVMNDENTIVTDFGHEEIKNEQGESVRPKNYNISVFPYDKLFVQPDLDQLRRKYGGSAPMGSKASTEDEWESEESSAQNDAPVGRTRTRGAAAATEQPAARERTRSRTAPPAEQPAAPATGTRTRARPAPSQTSGLADMDDEIPF